VMRISEEDLRRVQQDMTADVVMRKGGVRKGKVVSKGSQAGRDRLYEVKVLVDNPKGDLKPGAFIAHVKIETETHEGLLVPVGVAVQSGEGYVVYCVADGKAVAVPVKRGRTQGEFLEVSGKLDESSDIVIDGQARLKDGAVVRVVSE